MAQEQSLFDLHKELVGQFVRVGLQDGTHTSGVLYCIDPETDHVALLSQREGGAAYSVKIVLGHDVDSLEKEERDDGKGLCTLAALQEAVQHDSVAMNQADNLQHRQELLQQLLDKNFVPFEAMADGSIRVFGGAATLHEPFRVVECANEQLLRRLQQLLLQLDQSS